MSSLVCMIYTHVTYHMKHFKHLTSLLVREKGLLVCALVPMRELLFFFTLLYLPHMCLSLYFDTIVLLIYFQVKIEIRVRIMYVPLILPSFTFAPSIFHGRGVVITPCVLVSRIHFVGYILI